MNSFLALFGLLLVATPGIDQRLNSDSGDEADQINWMMQQPLEKLFLYRAFVLGGFLLLVAAAALP